MPLFFPSRKSFVMLRSEIFAALISLPEILYLQHLQQYLSQQFWKVNVAMLNMFRLLSFNVWQFSFRNFVRTCCKGLCSLRPKLQLPSRNHFSISAAIFFFRVTIVLMLQLLKDFWEQNFCLKMMFSRFRTIRWFICSLFRSLTSFYVVISVIFFLESINCNLSLEFWCCCWKLGLISKFIELVLRYVLKCYDGSRRVNPYHIFSFAYFFFSFLPSHNHANFPDISKKKVFCDFYFLII